MSGLSGTEVGIAANGNADQALALEPNGTVAAWGDNAHGEASSACAHFCLWPELVPGVSNAIAIAASAGYGTARSMALESSGQVLEWGSSPLGNGTYPGGSSTPVAVTGMNAASVIAAGALDSLALAPPPPGRFSLRYLKCNCGLPTLKIHLPFPGLLTLHQLGTPSPGPVAADALKKFKAVIKPTVVTVTKSRVVTVKLRLTAAGKRALRRKHKLRVKVLIAFTPRGGHPASRTLAVRFKQHR